MAAPYHITHVIFDMDGTLLDTESVCTKICQTIYAKYNKVYTEEIRNLVTGRAKRDSFGTGMKHVCFIFF